MRTLLNMSVLSQSLSSLCCRICMGDQRRFLFNRHNNIIKYYPSSGISRYCPLSLVPGPSFNTDPRGEPALPDHSSFSARRRSVIACGGIIVTPPDLFTICHPGCRNGNVSLKSGQRITVCPDRPHEKRITSVQSRRCCRCPSNNDFNVCSSVFGTNALNSCCNRSSISGISGVGFIRSVLDSVCRIPVR